MREVLVRYLGEKKFIFKNPAISEPIDLRSGGNPEVWIPYGDYVWFLEFNPTMFELIDERYATEPRLLTEPAFGDMTITELVDYAEDYLKTKINIAGMRKPEIILMVRGLWGEKNKGEKPGIEPEVLGESVEEEDQAGLSDDERQEDGILDPDDSAEAPLRSDEDA